MFMEGGSPPRGRFLNLASIYRTHAVRMQSLVGYTAPSIIITFPKGGARGASTKGTGNEDEHNANGNHRKRENSV